MFRTETTRGQQVEITEETVSLDASTVPTALVKQTDVTLNGSGTYTVSMHMTPGGIITIPDLSQQDAMIIAGQL